MAKLLVAAALVCLGGCLIVPVRFFLGEMSEAQYRAALLTFSIGWFLFAVAAGVASRLAKRV